MDDDVVEEAAEERPVPVALLRPNAEAELKAKGVWLLEKSTGSVCSLLVGGTVLEVVDDDVAGVTEEEVVVETPVDCCC